MELIQTKLNIQTEQPIRLLHISDTHLTYADLRDGERKVALAQKRGKHFVHAEEILHFASEYSKENG
ncbi:MAG: hypothetical protein IKC59_07385, partial [Clostridia bacterium]|nr:hypothetical protein [Clostridia bacterium]